MRPRLKQVDPDQTSVRQGRSGVAKPPAPAGQLTRAEHARILELQKAGGNRFAQRVSSGAGAPSVAQRRVALAKEAMTDNAVVQTSLHYAVQLAKGPIELLKDADLGAMEPHDELFIVAHGQPGKSGDYSAGQIVDFLFKAPKPLKNAISAIRFTSCHAGRGQTDDMTDSVVARVRDKLVSLGWHGVTVSGARSSSVKSAATGPQFTVVDYNERPWAKEIQKLLEEVHKPQVAYDDAVQEFTTREGRAPTALEKAELANRATADFFKAFVPALRDPAGFVAYLEHETKPGGSLESHAADMPRLRALATRKIVLEDGMLELRS